jgi:hypothetical protein
MEDDKQDGSGNEHQPGDERFGIGIWHGMTFSVMKAWWKIALYNYRILFSHAPFCPRRLDSRDLSIGIGKSRNQSQSAGIDHQIAIVPYCLGWLADQTGCFFQFDTNFSNSATSSRQP